MKVISVSNPLSLIAIFASLAESIALGILPFSKHLTDGHVWAIIGFAVTFPTLMAGVFWWVLIFRHKHLFSPDEHGKDNYADLFNGDVIKFDDTRDSKALVAIRAAEVDNGTVEEFDAKIAEYLSTNYAYDDDIMSFFIDASNDALHKKVLAYVKKELKK